MDPKKPGDSEERRASHSDDNEGDFDLSGFTSDDAAPAKPSRSAGKPAGEEPPRGKKVIGRAPRIDPRKTGPAPSEERRPPRDAAGAGAKPPAGKGGYPERKGPGGPGPSGPRGGWEKHPQRDNFRGKDQGFVPRGPRNAPGAQRGPGGPRDAAPRGGAGRYPDRGDSAGRPNRDYGAARGPSPKPYSTGTSRLAPRIIERVGGEHKPVSAEVKPFLPLKTDKGRWKESQFILEGSKNIADALSVSPAIIQTIFLAEEFDDKDLLTLIKKHRIQTIAVSMDDMRNLSDTETPQGILAVANFATLRPDYSLARYVTLLDAVQDPGNVGAIMRTSLALGMDAVVLGKGTCDPYNPKVVRSSVGALLRLPFETGEDLGAKMEFLRLKGFSIVATSSHAPTTLENAKLRKKVALIMGNEGAGTGATYLDMADAVVKIPLKNKVESLNVAVAHGILSYQLIHGRT